MTAFSRIEGDGYVWEIRSVNHRGLDVRAKVPDSLSQLESDVVQMVRKNISRGKVDVVFRLQLAGSKTNNESTAIPVQLKNSLDSLVDALPGKLSPTIDLMALHRTIESDSSNNLDFSGLEESIKRDFQSVLDDFLAERQREGEALNSVLNEKVNSCNLRVAELEEQRQEQIETVRGNLENRIAALQVEVDATRIAQEVALIAQRADYVEELERVRVHLDEIESRLSTDEPIGRRLTFLSQELLREASTLASKAQTPECASLAVDLKVFVDEIREQAQNIE